MKRLFLLILVFSVIAIAEPIQANAAWQKNNNGQWYSEGNSWVTGWRIISGDWYYFDLNGYMQTGWTQVNEQWYYFDSKGYMKTGWICNNETYYYLDDNGALEDFRTTIIMPSEIKIIYDVIKEYSPLYEIVKYGGIYNVTTNDPFDRIGITGKRLYEFYSLDEYGDEANEYCYDQITGNLYKLNQGIITVLTTNNEINNTSKSITSDQAIQKVREYFTSRSKNVPSKIEYKYEYGNSYVIHCYDIFVDNTDTSGLYYVDKSTGNVTPMFGGQAPV